MLQVCDLLKTPTFQKFECIAGSTGVLHEVRSVSILEYEALFDDFSDFSADTLVLTSLFFAKENPDKIKESLLALKERNVAGVAVKTIFFRELSDEVRALADRLELPLFLFQDTYMEDIVVTVNDLLKVRQNYLLLEEKINVLLQKDKSPAVISNAAREINVFFAPWIIAAYLLPKSKQSSLQDVRLFFERIFYKKYHELQNEPFSSIKYGQGILLLATFQQQDIPSDVLGYFRQRMRKLDLVSKNFYCGISTCHETFAQLDTAIEESMQANQIACFRQCDEQLYEDMGIHSYLLPLAAESKLALPWRQAVEILQDYDGKYTSNLFQTMQIYIEEHGEISAVAGRLYQHPNTIRYRLRKAKELLAAVFGKEDFYEQLFIAMRLDLYGKKI